MRLFDGISKRLCSIPDRKIKVFVCGPTLYNKIHLGHARLFIFVDVLVRFLSIWGVPPLVVVNVTDVDPKVIKGNNVSFGSATNERFKNFLMQLKYLGLSNHFIFARTSNFTEEAKKIIKIMMKMKYAYPSNGNIYIDTSKIENYGYVSHFSKTELLDRRLDIEVFKKDQRDLLLWNTNDHYGLSYPDNELGHGTPWWHTQDTAVATSLFKGKYDIHIGSYDLRFPHHEALYAILKTLTNTNKPVRCWMHIGHLNLNGIKMSNSSGNAIYLDTILKEYHPNVLRLYMLSEHYKNSTNYKARDLRKYESLNQLLLKDITEKMFSNNNKRNESILVNEFYKRIEDDLDIPKALNFMIDKLSEFEPATLRKLMYIFGLRY
ncbi:MAG: class I tRNA ligase family protein [Nitrososphaeraceae archaeon]